MIVYVSSPYSADSIEQVKTNVEFASEIGKQVLLAGHVPLVPHRMSALWDKDSRLQHLSHEDWLLKFALPLLDKADAILVAGPWETSRGCLAEYSRAKYTVKRIFYSIDDLKKEATD